MLLQNLVPFITLLLNTATTAHQTSCKVYPNDPAWPNLSVWQALNDTVSGRLVVPTSLGTACRPGQSFDNATCTTIATQWSNTSWVAENPWLVDYNDLSCPPQPGLPCDTAGYPAYTIEAVDEKDVQAGIKFAREHNIRLVIKATGHDYPGRSSGPGSLSIWTHKIRGIDVVPDDPLAAKYGGVASVKVHAGMRWGEVYREMAKQNLTVVGGADPNVGIGGWTLNGGHSPISSLYGLGADQVLSLDVVTADAKYLTVNETNHPDLFWALRGGGGSTYAVMVSMTVKAYPRLDGIVHAYSYVTKADSDTYWGMVTYFHTQIPRISAAGGMGYHYMVRGSSLGDPALTDIDILTGAWIFPSATEKQVNETMGTLVGGITSAEWAVEPIRITANNTYFPSHSAFWAAGTPENAGTSGRLGSWLLDEKALTSNFTDLKIQLQAADPKPWTMISHVIGGKGLQEAAKNLPGGSNAVLPAWRKACTHLVLPRSWPTTNLTLKPLLTTSLRETAMPALKRLAPDSGAYINECDPTNPAWKHDYFGANYNRLLHVKHRYDPTACSGVSRAWAGMSGRLGMDRLRRMRWSGAWARGGGGV